MFLLEDNVDKANTHFVSNYGFDECTYNPITFLNTSGFCEPEELARIILVENPDAIEPFGTLEEMIEYIREAISVVYVPLPEPAPIL
jgi:hypothetical protein